jgi:hypothetical protein
MMPIPASAFRHPVYPVTELSFIVHDVSLRLHSFYADADKTQPVEDVEQSIYKQPLPRSQQPQCASKQRRILWILAL